MIPITTLTEDPNQLQKIILSDGSVITFTFNYSANQKGWFYSLSYLNKVVLNRRLVVGPNLLRAFRNILPFGLACTSTDGYEPVLLNDFISERVKLTVTTIEENAEIEEILGTLSYV